MANQTHGADDFIALSSDEEGEVISSPPSAAPEDIPESLLQELRRYFPSAADPSNMCLSCGQDGHIAERCTFPSSAADGEGSINAPCSSCGSLEHISGSCPHNWRSYQPDPKRLKRVVFVAAACSACGSRKHFSADCEAKKSATSDNSTWSLQNRDMYIDSECGHHSIEEAAGLPAENGPSVGRAPGTKIRSRVAASNNVHYSESDESEVEFLGHHRVGAARAATPPHIRVASNLQLPGLPTNASIVGTVPPQVQGKQNKSAKSNTNKKKKGPGASTGSSRATSLDPGAPTRRSAPMPPAEPGSFRSRGPGGLPPKPPGEYRSVPSPFPSGRGFSGGKFRGRGQGARGNRGGRGRGRGRGG